MKKKIFSICLFIGCEISCCGLLFAKGEANKKENNVAGKKVEEDWRNKNVSKVNKKGIERMLAEEDSANSGSEVKEIEVNSVNFIKLSRKVSEIFIPNPKIADVDMLTDNSLYVTGLSPGVTPLIAHDKEGNVVIDYQIRVTYPLNEIKRAIHEMHPESSVDIVSVEDSIILRGKVSSPEAANDIQDIVARCVKSDKIVNKLSIETATQVMLKVKIAEVSRDVTRSMGIHWKAISSAHGLNGLHWGFVARSPEVATATIPPIDDNDAPYIDVISNVMKPALKSGSGGRWVMHSGGTSNALSSIIEALSSESFASVLAEPTLVALSGKTAKFNSGGEEGYQVNQPGGTVSTTEFKQWGTSIEFTPIVMGEDRINITVKPTISTLNHATVGTTAIPSLTTKSASTTVELGSGQSLAIAGLLQTNKSSSTEETPFLADIPIIGPLFRSSNLSSIEKEIIIIVTPYIVKPSSKLLVTPVDMIPKMYSPLDSILKRKFHKNIKKGGHSAGFSLR